MKRILPRCIFTMLCLLILISFKSFGQCSSGKFTGTVSNSNACTFTLGSDWSNPGNITANDALKATNNVNAAGSNCLLASNFGFNIPTSATINGVVVEVARRKASGGNIADNSVHLFNGFIGSVQIEIGDEFAAAGNWPTSETVINYGSATNGWNASLTPAIINGANFGVKFQAKRSSFISAGVAEVNYIKITVYYTLSTPITSPNAVCISSTGNAGSVATISGASYVWTITGGSITSSTTTSAISYTAGTGSSLTLNVTATPSGSTCTAATGTKAITISPLPLTYTLSGSSICSFAPNTGTVSLSNSQTNFTYQLKDATNSNVQSAKSGTTGASLTWTGLPAGNGYYVVATGAAPANCSSQTTTVNIAIIGDPGAPTGNPNQSFCPGSTVANLAASGSSIKWYSASSGGSALSPSTNLINGMHYFATQTVNGCEGQTRLEVIVTVNQHASISLSSAAGTDTQSGCNNVAITSISYTLGSGATGAQVTGLPPGVDGIFNANTVTISGTPTAAGIYNYTVQATSNCNPATANGTITVNALPAGTYSATNISICGGTNDGTITISPSGGTAPYTYSWTGITGSGNPATTPFTAGNVSALINLPIGYYDVSITDASGCSTSISGMHIKYAFSVYVTNSGSISSGCANTGSIILYGNAGVQPYSYSLDNLTYQQGNTFTSLAPGPYTAYVKDAAGCISTKSIFVAAAPPIIVQPFARAASSCSNDGVIEIYRTGGIPPYSYSLTNNSYQAGNIFSGLAAGNYTCYVKDSKGCIGVTPVTINQGAALAITASKTLVSSCVFDGSIQLRPVGGTGPYTYSLDDINYQNSNSFTGLHGGNYTGWVKDSKGCKGSVNVTLNVNLIAVTTYVVNASDCYSANGSILLFRTGGIGPYTYSLDGNVYQTSNSFMGKPAGNYDGFVKDSKACIGSLLNIVVGPAECSRITAKAAVNLFSQSKQAVSQTTELPAMTVFPNPFTESFSLLTGYLGKQPKLISIIDLAGRKLFSITGIDNTYKLGAALKPGVYFLQRRQGDEIQTIKIVKQ